MKHLFILPGHLFTTIARLLRPGGARAIVAESILLKQQLLVVGRPRHRAPDFTALERFLSGLWALLLGERRIPRVATILRPSTLLRVHDAFKKRKYRLLYTPRHGGKPGIWGGSRATSRSTIMSAAFTRRSGEDHLRRRAAKACFAGRFVGDFGRKAMAEGCSSCR
jgi:hypothetical protein